MSQPTLILASGSPRRRQLLAEAGYTFKVVTPRDGAEPPGLCSNCGPAETVATLAESKWRDVVDQVRGDGNALLLAADTVAECDGVVLGKPRDEEDARAMIRRLSGRVHRVFTGVCLGLANVAEPVQQVVTTELTMDQVSEEWLGDYIESGEWEGKAGGFGYQDSLGFVHVTWGSESNVVGLPMEEVHVLLESHGITQPQDDRQTHERS